MQRPRKCLVLAKGIASLAILAIRFDQNQSDRNATRRLFGRTPNV